MKRLSRAQTEVLKRLHASRDRYELRVGEWGDAYLYDREMFCPDDWPLWVSTVKALERGGYIQELGRDRVTRATRYALTDKAHALFIHQ